jgi:hypothetical protein
VLAIIAMLSVLLVCFVQPSNEQMLVVACLGVYAALCMQLCFNTKLNKKIAVYDDKLEAMSISERVRMRLELKLFTHMSSSLMWLRRIAEFMIRSQKWAIRAVTSDEHRLKLLIDMYDALNPPTITWLNCS